MAQKPNEEIIFAGLDLSDPHKRELFVEAILPDITEAIFPLLKERLFSDETLEQVVVARKVRKTPPEETLSHPELEPLRALSAKEREITNALLSVRDELKVVVTAAHDQGYSWSQIGAATGMTRRAAHNRWSEKGPEASKRSKSKMSKLAQLAMQENLEA